MKRELSIFNIAATYIGTVVGAGFASGQEVLQYFGYHGTRGYIGLAIATIIFIIYGYITLALGQKLKADSHYKVIMYSAGPYFGRVVDWVITFFLFIALTAMLAGTGAIFKEQFGLPPILGNIFMAAITLVTALTGIAGIINAISAVVPVLILGVFFTGGYTLLTNPGSSLVRSMALSTEPIIQNPWLSGIVYASYNLVMAVAILAPLGKEVPNRNRLFNGALWGGISLGVSAIIIQMTLLLNMPSVSNYEIPMLYVTSRISPVFTIVYSLILISEIYSTALGGLYGFVARFTDTKGPQYVTYLVITIIVAIVCSQLGFSNMVRYLYSVVGIAGLILLGGLTFTAVTGKLST
ncbi:MAG: hypothetical protein QME46_08795 [Thermoanaerobacteraceae bacterium]|nr:hypothetical protein [Thermoanaerobacteraceae bacterium]